MAESTPPTRSVAWDAAADPAAAWAEVQQRARTDEPRACVAAASRQADRIWIAMHSGRLTVSKPTATVPARNADWHRLALSGYEVLRESGAYAHLAQVRPWACAAAEPILAAWLHGPTPSQPGDEGATDAPAATVAQRLGVGDAIHLINGDTQAAHLSALLDAAQDAAVFGIPGHRVELVTANRAHPVETVVRVVVEMPSGAALASEPLELGILVDAEATGVDAATAALRRVADVATDLFGDYARAVWQAPPPMPTVDLAASPAGRAFPELVGHQPAEPPVPPAPTAGRDPAMTPRTAPHGPSRTGGPR
jgi:hypothetical protein